MGLPLSRGNREQHKKAPHASKREGLEDGIELTFAQAEADEAFDDDVLAEFANLFVDDVADRFVGVFDEGLFQQAEGVVNLLELALDNFFNDGRWLVFDLRGGDFFF